MLVVCACAVATDAHALDWSLYSTLTERAEVSDNEFLSPKPFGPSLGSFSTVTGNALARTPTSRFELNGDVTYTKYLGPGTQALQQTEAINTGISARFENLHKLNTDRDYVEGSWRRQNTALALLNQTGLTTTVNGDVDVSTIRGGIERSLSALDLITVSARATSTDYQPSNAGTHYLDASAIGTWRHQLFSTTDLTASSEAERLSYDDPAKTNVTILRELAGVRSQLSPRLSFNGTGGVAILQVNQNVPIAPATLAVSKSDYGFIGNMLLTYRLLKTTDVSLSASRSIAPTIVGSLLLSTSFGISVVHAINQSSSLSLSADLSRQSGVGTQSDFLSASIGYSKLLARDWTTQATYRFLRRGASTATATSLIFDPITGIPLTNGISGPANSNTIILALSHSITALPPGQ